MREKQVFTVGTPHGKRRFYNRQSYVRFCEVFAEAYLLIVPRR